MNYKMINGAQGEGGGQVLRTALALSILTQQPVQIDNIRANRPTPGLKPQHLAGVRAAAEICGAEVERAGLGATSIRFTPRHAPQAGRYTFDITALAEQPSAGSVTLLLQTILLPLVFAGSSSHLVLRGGTHVAWSPPVHYTQWVLLPILARMGVQSESEIINWGWYPKGEGELHVTLHGVKKLRGIKITEKGDIVEVKGVAAATNLPAHIPQRICNRANNLLDTAGLPRGVRPLRNSGPSTGAGLFMAAVYENIVAGFDSLGKKGKPSEKVAEEATSALIRHHQQESVLDAHLPDQLLPFMALAEGESIVQTIQLTGHTLTNAALIEEFIDREIDIQGIENQPGIVIVKDR